VPSARGRGSALLPPGLRRSLRSSLASGGGRTQDPAEAQVVVAGVRRAVVTGRRPAIRRTDLTPANQEFQPERKSDSAM
jgi:hypothetical protein